MGGNRCRKIPAAACAAAIAARRLLRGASCDPAHHVFWHTGPTRGTATPQRSAAAAGPLVAGCHRGPAGQAAAGPALSTCRPCSASTGLRAASNGPRRYRSRPAAAPRDPCLCLARMGNAALARKARCHAPSFAGRHRPCAVPMGRPLAGRRIRGHRPKRRQCAPGGPNGWPMRGGCRAGSAHRPRAAWSDCFP